MAKRKKEKVISVYRIWYHVMVNRKKTRRTVGSISSTSPKEAVIAFKQGEGKHLFKNAIHRPDIAEQLKAAKEKDNYRVFLAIENDGKVIQKDVGFIYAYSPLQAISGLSKGQGRIIIPEVFQSETLYALLRAEIVVKKE